MLLKHLVLFIYATGLYILGLYIWFLDNDHLFWKVFFDEPLEPVYDYIVVGAGSAGSVIALRLAEDPNVTVLLLEAGPHSSSLLSVPIAGPALQLTRLDWQYKTVPQKHACFGLKGRMSNWPMGRLVGGTGRLNNLIYSRGHPDDYEGWFKSDPGYDYEYDILQYFKKAENQMGKYANDTRYHSTNGPLVVNDLPFATRLSNHLLKAAQALGYRICDVNADCNTGFMHPQVNVLSGLRYLPADHLLQQNQPNLRIASKSTISKILFRDNYEAYAVKLPNKLVRARRAIILSAGVIGTPKLLMLSGVGPKDHLLHVGITPKIHLPVGDNLQDHVTTGLDLIELNRTIEMGLEMSMSPFSVLTYLLHASGPLSSPGCEVVGFISTDNSTRPDLQIMLIPTGISADNGIHFQKIMGISSESSKYFNNLLYKTVVSMLPIVLHPKSRGTVRLRDKKIDSKPLIDPNYLSDRYDVEILVKGIEIIRNLLETPAMQKFGAKFVSKKFPNCEIHKFGSADYWECYVRHLTLTSYHPIGSCKMGALNDSGVVDYDFRVHGMNNLFVVDASVIPSLPSGNTNAIVVMMAEKAAAEVKKRDYLMRGSCAKMEIFVTEMCCQRF